MQIKEIMSKQVITVKRSTTFTQLVKLFVNFHTFPLVPVVEDGNKLIGMVSFHSLLEVFKPYRPEVLKNIPFLEEEPEDIFNTDISSEMGELIVVDDIMEKKYISVWEDSLVVETYNMLKLHSLERVAVVDKSGGLVGMVGMFDIVLSVFREKGIIG